MCHIDVKLGCTLFHDNRCQSHPRQAVKDVLVVWWGVVYGLMVYIHVVLHVVVEAQLIPLNPPVLVHQVAIVQLHLAIVL